MYSSKQMSNNKDIQHTNNKFDALVEAKKEYSNDLKDILVPQMYSKILDIYKQGKLDFENKNVGNAQMYDTLMQYFQYILSQIPKWTSEDILLECNRIKETSNCNWLDMLVTAVFVTNSKIRAINKNPKISYNNVRLDIPKLHIFIHECYIEAARKLWKNAYLFDDDISDYEYQKNIRDIEVLLGEGIDLAVRRKLPTKKLLNEYLGENAKSVTFNDNDITSMSIMSHDNLHKVLQKELDQISNISLNLNNDEIVSMAKIYDNDEKTSFVITDNVSIPKQTNKESEPHANEESEPYHANKELEPHANKELEPHANEESEPYHTNKELEPHANEESDSYHENEESDSYHENEESDPNTKNIHIGVNSVYDNNSVTRETNNIIDNGKDNIDLSKLTKFIENNKQDVNIDTISVSDTANPNAFSNSAKNMKQFLNDSQHYSISSSRRRKKYNKFMLRN